VKKSIAQIIKDLRTRLGDSQQAFSNRLGLSTSTITKAEAGREPSSDILYQMSILAFSSGFLDIAKTLNDKVIADTGRVGLRRLPDVRIALVEAMAILTAIPGDQQAAAIRAMPKQHQQVGVAMMQAAVDALRKIDAALAAVKACDAVTPVMLRMNESALPQSVIEERSQAIESIQAAIHP